MINDLPIRSANFARESKNQVLDTLAAKLAAANYNLRSNYFKKYKSLDLVHSRNIPLFSYLVSSLK